MEKYFTAIVSVDLSAATTERVELVAASWKDARALLHARFGADSIVDLVCVEDAERPR